MFFFFLHVDFGDIAVNLGFRSWYFKILTCGRVFCFSLHLSFCPCAGGKVRILGGEAFVECICFILFFFFCILGRVWIYGWCKDFMLCGISFSTKCGILLLLPSIGFCFHIYWKNVAFLDGKSSHQMVENRVIWKIRADVLFIVEIFYYTNLLPRISKECLSVNEAKCWIRWLSNIPTIILANQVLVDEYVFSVWIQIRIRQQGPSW